MTSPPAIAILHSGRPSSALQRFLGLARAMGIEDSPAHFDPAALECNAGCLVIDVSSLSRDDSRWVTITSRILCSPGPPVLLLNCDANAESSRFLMDATGNRSIPPRNVHASEFQVRRDVDGVGRELLGLQFACDRRDYLAMPMSDAPSDISPILSFDDTTSFAEILRFPRRVFLWCCEGIFDMYRPLLAESEMEDALPNILPGIIFTKAFLGERCWKPSPAAISLIVDDPLLRPRYGSLDFPDLLAAVRKNRWHVSLAFIPINSTRTRIADAKLFQSYSDCFSLCVHGNDHTRDEFHSQNDRVLEHAASVALRRMSAHAKRVGLDYEPVMVFPQERYTVAAIRAIRRRHGYFGIANTRCIPDDDLGPRRVTGSDLLQPITDTWFGVPILKRHYASEEKSRLAIELFLGRPLIIAEHHQFFRNGIGNLERLAHEIETLCPGVVWRSPGQILRTTFRQRSNPDGTRLLQIFADKFSSQFVEGSHLRYVISRRTYGEAEVAVVEVDGSPTSFSRDGDYLKIVVDCEPGAPIDVSIVMRKGTADNIQDGARLPSPPVGAMARRRLSELRDYFTSKINI